jgi:hypothetical protein
MRNIVLNHRAKFHDDWTRNERALGFFEQRRPLTTTTTAYKRRENL